MLLFPPENRRVSFFRSLVRRPRMIHSPLPYCCRPRRRSPHSSCWKQHLLTLSSPCSSRDNSWTANCSGARFQQQSLLPSHEILEEKREEQKCRLERRGPPRKRTGNSKTPPLIAGPSFSLDLLHLKKRAFVFVFVIGCLQLSQFSV